jgi:hypothetical protein
MRRWLIVLVAVLGMAGAGVAAAAPAAASGGNQTYKFKVAYWEAASGVYWTCMGVHKVRATGAVSDSETCTTTASVSAFGNFVAGTYHSNALVFPGAFPGGCGGYVPGVPGYNAPNGYTYFVSDYPGFGKCAQFVTWTFAPTLSGGWKDTINTTY